MKVLNMHEIRHKQEDPLNLRSLPLVMPDEDGWPVIESALRRQSQRGRRWKWAGGTLAVAATAVMALSLLLGQPFDGPQTGTPEISRGPVAQEAESVPLMAPTLESLIAMSQQLEGRVRLYREQVGDLSSDALVYQVELQDLIVQVDEELSMNPGSRELWGQRVNLLLDVTQLYESSLRRDYQQMASL
ncbi:MAG: hypothetical protein V2I48_01390 [Xanthomonadales bacterium]|jgi:hypothetical protein|nr:hypothetical protein [Xanthomonadales bacterium]